MASNFVPTLEFTKSVRHQLNRFYSYVTYDTTDHGNNKFLQSMFISRETI